MVPSQAVPFPQGHPLLLSQGIIYPITYHKLNRVIFILPREKTPTFFLYIRDQQVSVNGNIIQRAILIVNISHKLSRKEVNGLCVSIFMFANFCVEIGSVYRNRSMKLPKLGQFKIQWQSLTVQAL